jgi:hypothetical protein
MFKTTIESRENRRAIEEICRETLGHDVTLSVSVGGQSESEPTEEKKEKARVKQKAENDPKLRALMDKFRTDRVEIIPKPEG